MSDGKDNFGLEWIRSELDTTLDKARHALEEYAVSGGDATRMRACVTHLHQVHGTLQILNLRGVTLLSEELEQFAQAFLNDAIADSEAAQQILMQGILKLPAILEEIQSGAADAPEAVLALVNEARRQRGVEALAVQAALGAGFEPPTEASLARFERIDGPGKTRRIRTAYQRLLLAILRGEGGTEAAATLGKVALGLEQLCADTPWAEVWRAFGVFVRRLDGAIAEPGGDIVRLLRRVDAEIKGLARDGREALARPVPPALLRNLNEAAQKRGFDDPALARLAASTAPASAELPAPVSDGEALRMAAAALRDELAGLQDRLDLYVRGGEGPVEAVQELAAPLRQIGGTLSLLGFDEECAAIRAQAQTLAGLAPDAAHDESILLGVAASLLEIDERLAGPSRGAGGTGGSSIDRSGARDAVIAQARAGLEQVKQAVMDYVSTQWDRSQLSDVPEQLSSVRGALAMIDLETPALLVGRCARYVERELLGEAAPEGPLLDHFAEALSGLDYYLERLSGASPGADEEEILTMVQESLSALGYADIDPDAEQFEPQVLGLVQAREPEPPRAEADGLDGMTAAGHEPAPREVDEPPESVDEADADASAQQPQGETIDLTDTLLDEASGDELGLIPIGEPQAEQTSAVEESAGAEEPATVEPPPEVGTLEPPRKVESPDEEIVEIFAEEVEELLGGLDGWLDRWAQDGSDAEALAEIRRAFHTLKGSGRLAGATGIGELAWSVENMLNRALDGTVTASGNMVALVRQARHAVAELAEALRAGQLAAGDGATRLIEQADVLASGGSLDDLEPARDDALEEFDIALIDVGEGDSPLEEGAQASGADAVRSGESHAPPAEDHETLALFELDALRHIELLEEHFNNADHTRSGLVDDAVLRALHTLSGSASVAGIDAIHRLAAALNKVVGHLQDRGRRPDADALDFLRRGVAALRRAIDALRAGDVPREDCDPVEAEAARLVEEGKQASQPLTALLDLPAARVLLDADSLLEGWRQGRDTAEGFSELVAALHEVRNEAESHGQAALCSLCDALLETYQQLEDRALEERAAIVLHRAHELLLAIFDSIAADQRMPASDEVITELERVRAELQEVAPSAAADDTASEPVRVAELDEDGDPELLALFLEEAEELLEDIEHSIHAWLGERDNRIYLENLLRALHTLKGGARLAGLSALGDQTHRFESFLIDLQARAGFDDEVFEHLQRQHDELLSAIAGLRAGARPADAPASSQPQQRPSSDPSGSAAIHDDVVRASREATGEPSGEPSGEADRRAAPAAAPPGSGAGTGQAPRAERRDEAAARQEERAVLEARATQEMVRVSAMLLEQMLNLAGESSIVRSRIEQGISDFAGALDEMERTIERVREQLRRLEIETDSRVRYRNEPQGGPDYQAFDPLEMDRYTQLQELSRALSESASDMFDLKETLTQRARESEALLLQQARLDTELQEGLMRTRMVPFGRLVPRLERIVRQTAKELGKVVTLNADHVEGELDRNVLERMIPPLEHMLRNAVGHGIETPEQRRARGKAESGRIDLRLSRDGHDMMIEILDDGCGIDPATVRAKALERGMLEADAELDDEQVLQLIFVPGFSTAASVTQISGRGVGMDVVATTVKELGGSIDIGSTPGQGTRFAIRMPFKVAVHRALMVTVAEELYAIPLNAIEGIVRLPVDELERAQKLQDGTFEYAGAPYRLDYLGSYLGQEYVPGPDRRWVAVMLVRSGDLAAALHVDAIEGSREIVVKGLGPYFAGVGGISGATILGDGSVVVILDLVNLLRSQTTSVTLQAAAQPEVEERPRRVMVVDDSVTVRKVTSRLLARHGMDVVLAKDGVEAVSLLHEQRPDIVLLDIEMPRMDGFEVARQLRRDERTADLPIVMVTSRTGSKHQEHAAELGIDRFLGKPFQETELLATLDELAAR